MARPGPEGLDVAQDQHKSHLQLGEDQSNAEDKFRRARRIERFGDAPRQVARGNSRREHGKEDGRPVAFEGVRDQERGACGDGKNHLAQRVHVDRHGDA